MASLFESLVLEAKAAGHGWKRSSGTVSCANGRCVLGAVIAARGVPCPRDDEGVAVLEGSMAYPTAEDAALLLAIDEDTAAEIIAANDGTEPELAEALDKLLGIEHPKPPEMTGPINLAGL